MRITKKIRFYGTSGLEGFLFRYTYFESLGPGPPITGLGLPVFLSTARMRTFTSCPSCNGHFKHFSFSLQAQIRHFPFSSTIGMLPLPTIMSIMYYAASEVAVIWNLVFGPLRSIAWTQKSLAKVWDSPVSSHPNTQDSVTCLQSANICNFQPGTSWIVTCTFTHP